MKEMKITLLGSGNVAAFLFHGLRKNGAAVEKIISRNREKGEALAAGTDTLWSNDFSDLGSPGNIVISALKDSAAEEVWKRCVFGKRLVLHTAGSLPMDALAPFAEARGVLYPLQTISARALVESRSVPFLIEADSCGNLEKVRALAEILSPMVKECSSEAREKIHLAAVFANNFSNLCFHIAWELAEKEGVDPRMLLPLIEESCAKLRVMSPAEAQTGPAVRFDENVMAKHLELLKDAPESAAFYRLASAEIHRRKK